MLRFLVGLIIGLLVLPLGGLAYFKLGKPPVATADPPLPLEKQIVAIPLAARIAREMPRSVPITADEATFTAGAAVYQTQCAPCHGLPDHDSAFAKGMFPRAPQLFQRHGDHVGVSDDEPGETYWKVANGIRLSGMPAFDKILTEKEMWQVTLLAANADKLSAGVLARLKPDAK
jgi:mono/diheme cytochrome c family protein